MQRAGATHVLFCYAEVITVKETLNWRGEFCYPLLPLLASFAMR
jgi:hypothetical protein